MKTVNIDMEKLGEARRIIVSSLRACYDKEGIVAGRQHFSEYWARDSFFASFGVLELKNKRDTNIVKKNLELFLNNTKNGEVPTLFDDLALIKLILDIFNVKLDKVRLKPIYTPLQPYFKKYPSIDVGFLLLNTMRAYYEKTGDIGFIKKNFKKLEDILHYSETFLNEKTGLIIEHPSCAWDDSIMRNCESIYVNALYYKATFDLSYLAGVINHNNSNRELLKNSSEIKQRINDVLWNNDKGFYSDSTCFKDYFSTAGNLLAIIYGIADRKKSRQIIEFIDNKKLNYPVPTRTNYPLFPRNRIHPLIRLTGLAGYHNDNQAWLWIGALELIARKKTNSNYRAVLSGIVDKILEYKVVHEIYDKKGNPFRGFFYKSEHPFAWSSGLLIYALSNLNLF